MTYENIKNDPAIRTYITQADASLTALGYTEHSFAHVGFCAETAGRILETLGFPERTVELAKIAGYLHDIGNLVNRVEHSQTGAIMAFRLLDERGFPPEEIALVATAIGNHDEGTGVAVNDIAAALILADKCDVRRSRVRSKDFATFDIHDRVNYSVTESRLRIDREKAEAGLELTIDTEVCAIMDYFEIFMGRMLMCRKAAQRLGLKFTLVVNGQTVM